MLFDPVKIGKLELANRLVRSATAERMAGPRGECTPDMVDLYRTLAKGGTGLLITGHAFVRSDGKTNVTMTGIDHDDRILGLEKLIEAVHRASDARIVMQISHAGRQTDPELTGNPLIAPSPVPVKLSGNIPREMSSDEVWEMVHLFGQATRRVQEAGFDGLELHGAHGYLIAQFLSPYTNRRTDRWGGCPENRQRFVLEVYREAREGVGGDFPILIKLNADDLIPNGLTVKESVQVALELEKGGMNGIEVSAGIAESSRKITRTGIKSEGDEAYFRDYAKNFKQMGVKIPLALVGGIRSLKVAEGVLVSGDADLISLSRPLIRQPDLPNLWKNGENERADCISCSKCLKDRFHPLHCMELERIRKETILTAEEQ